MKNLLLFIVIAVLFTACKKKVEERPPLCLAYDMPKPAFVLSYSLSGSTVTLDWRRQGQTWYTVYHNGTPIHTCRCGEYTLLISAGTHTFRVNNSNVVTVTVQSPQPPGTPQVSKKIRVDFDGGIVSTVSWYGLSGYNLPGSGLSDFDKLVVLNNV